MSSSSGLTKAKALKPVSRVTLGEQVAEQLADQIVGGRWRSGDKLPSESELCATLQIGRSTLREALKSLAFVGMVQMRPGEGTYVLDGTQPLVDQIHAKGLLKSENSLAAVVEARLALETELASLAAERATPADFERMEQILEEMRSALTSGAGNYAALDVEFHMTIARAARSEVLFRLLEAIRSAVQEFISKSQDLPGIRETAHQYHSKLISTLKERDPEKARRMMRKHLQTCEKAFHLIEKISDTTAKEVAGGKASV